jgi:hypothetical protein
LADRELLTPEHDHYADTSAAAFTVARTAVNADPTGARSTAASAAITAPESGIESAGRLLKNAA